MNYKIILILFILISCSPIERKVNINFKQSFSNSGFTLVFNDTDFNEKRISKKIDQRSLTVFQKNMRSNTNVKVTNLLNNKSIIAIVGEKSDYPLFYNSVITKRIADEIELNIKEPYISIIEINENTTFVANKTKTFEEERVVAEKAPVDEIGIKDLSSIKIKKVDKNIKKKDFKYVIKIADFYFIETAKNLKKRIKNELNVNNVKINEISKTEFRVYLGPYDNLKKIKEIYEKILKLEFENIEILKL